MGDHNFGQRTIRHVNLVNSQFIFLRSSIAIIFAVSNVDGHFCHGFIWMVVTKRKFFTTFLESNQVCDREIVFIFANALCHGRENEGVKQKLKRLNDGTREQILGI